MSEESFNSLFYGIGFIILVIIIIPIIMMSQ